MKVSKLEKPARTDWKRVDEMKDEDIDISDIPPLDETFFVNAKLRIYAEAHKEQRR